MGHRCTPQCLSRPGRPGRNRPDRPVRRVQFRLPCGERGGRADRRQAPGAVLRLCHGECRARRREHPGHGGGGRYRVGRLRYQGAPARCAHLPGSVRGGPLVRAPGALRRHGRGVSHGAGGGPVPGRRLRAAASRQLRRRLARPASGHRPARPAPQCLHRHVGCPPVRPARRGRAPGRAAEGALRDRRAVASPGGGTRESTCARAVPRPGAAGARRKLVPADGGGAVPGRPRRRPGTAPRGAVTRPVGASPLAPPPSRQPVLAGRPGDRGDPWAAEQFPAG